MFFFFLQRHYNDQSQTNWITKAEFVDIKLYDITMILLMIILNDHGPRIMLLLPAVEVTVHQ